MNTTVHCPERLPDQYQLDWLVQCGVTGKEIVDVSRLPEPTLLHIARVTFGRDEFSYDPDGQPAFILAIWNGGQVEELVAWTKTKFAPLLGWKFALSEFLLSEPVLCDEPLPVYRRPLTWLRHHGDGLVILNKKRAFSELSHVDRVLAEDVRHGEELRRMLRPPKPDVKILVRPEALAT